MISLHMKTNVHHWKHPWLKQIDDVLSKNSREIDIDWNSCELEKGDSDHFTENGSKTFCYLLIKELSKYSDVKKLHIISDSTIAHNDYDGRVASTRLETELQKIGIDASVDAISGSGFVARAWADEHYRARVTRHLKSHKGENHAILFIGGWNDIHSGTSLNRVLTAVSSCTNRTLLGIRQLP